MTAIPSREVTTSEIASVGFSFYTDDEVRKLSIKHIQSPLSLDNLKQPVPGGLYDPALGPLGMFDTCATCGLKYRACPGHFGHIELSVPLYHPLVFGTLYKLLRCVCLHCFKFRLAAAEVFSPRPTAGGQMVPYPSQHLVFCISLLAKAQVIIKVAKFREKMKLIAEGNLEAASRIVISPGQVMKTVDELVGEAENEDLKLKGGSISTAPNHARIQRKRHRGCETTHTIEAARDCQLDFFKRIPGGGCQNCGAFSPVIKKEPGCKIFQKPLDAKKLVQNKLAGTEISSVLSSTPHSAFEAQRLEQQIAEHANSNPGVAKADDKKKKSEGKDDKFFEKDYADDDPAEDAEPQADSRQQIYMTVAEVREMMRRLWNNETEVLQFLYALDPRFKDPKLSNKLTKAKDDKSKQAFKQIYQMFFVQTVAVPPNNVRPVSKMGEMTFENPQNIAMTQIINYNLDLVSMDQMSQQIADATKSGNELGPIGPVGGIDINRSLRLWLSLQNSLNGLYDSTTAEGTAAGNQGIRQLLEKKEGLFRKNMMGKRVNFACRSVISPDPYLGSGELGIPPYFAVRLSVPERVTPLNVQELRQLVINGPFQHPGANAVEDESGRMVSLQYMDLLKREAVAKQLLSKQSTLINAGGVGQGMSGKIVYRHVRDGDVVLTNRQPTLHKPGLMAHRARVLKGERVIRMHYANCATFNADFDGDEINVHVPQDLHGRSEGYNIVHADHQYIVPTDGKPIRGLIQDHVIAGVQLTKRDTFLLRQEFAQLVYNAVGPTRPGLKDRGNIEIPLPALIKPKPLWTGKQVISTIVRHITKGLAPISLAAKCKVSEKYWGKGNNEEEFLFHTGDLVTGVMDKAQYGKFGLVHACQELYGNVTAGVLLSVLSRLWTFRLQSSGFTCGIGDLLLKPTAESKRTQLIADAERRATCAGADYCEVSTQSIADPTLTTAEAIHEKQLEVEKVLGEKYRTNKNTGAVHDRKVTSSVQPISSEVVDVCLPNGQIKPFPQNCLSLMTVTGAKGSQVNFSQISCLLGQQELEGRRVPRMASGKTLPCFGPYEGGARSGGYVSDRFLTGLRPQEYYFHCMAGREGLVDTTVKTSRSGYLQRCLVKNLESLRTNYDGTVRDSCDGSVVQFQYGEDGIDVLNSSFLHEMGFLAKNVKRLAQQECVGSQQELAASASLADEEKIIAKENKWRQKQLMKSAKGKSAETTDSRMPVSGMHFATRLGATSEKFQDKLGSFVRSNPTVFQARGQKRKLDEADVEDAKVQVGGEDSFRKLMNLRYMRALANPGEAVGVIAAQSVGEPSTQMTLNTFHMAGRGEANVTLGIPRLRELFMTASKSIKTPVMTMPLKAGKTKQDAEELLNRLRRIKLAEVLEDISIEESITNSDGMGLMVRKYTIRLKCMPESKLPKEAGLSFTKISEAFQTEFVRQLKAVAKKNLNAFARNAKISTAAMDEEVAAAKPANESEDSENKKKASKDDEDENAEENDEFDEGKLRFAGGRSEKGAMYDLGDKEDKDIAKQQEKDAEEREELPPDDENAQKDTKDEEKEASKSEVKDKNLMMDESIDSQSRICCASISIPLAWPKLLMLEIVEAIAAKVMIRHTDGIEKCYIIDGQKDPKNPDVIPPPALQTDGISFKGAWSSDDILDINRLITNDVGSILSTYGVEAARATLMREVSSVFGAYGIAVDPRHLGLIADFMTHQEMSFMSIVTPRRNPVFRLLSRRNSGGYRACSRIGIESSRSTFLKITFETASHFMTEATLKGVSDDLSSPASRIVVGRLVDLGTGTFALKQRLKDDDW